MGLDFIFRNIGLLVFLVVLYVVAKYVIIPYVRIMFYRGYGGHLYFSPGTGMIALMKKSSRDNRDSYHWLKSYDENEKGTRFYLLNIMDRLIFYLKDPALIKQFLFRQDQDYTKTKLLFADFNDMAYTGLLFGGGETWKRHRKLISQAFHFEFLKEMVPSVIDTTEEIIESWRKKNDLKDIDSIDRFQNIAVEIVGRIFFGSVFSDLTFEGQSFGTASARIINEIAAARFDPITLFLGRKYTNWLPSRKRLNALKTNFKGYIRGIVEEKKKSGATNLLKLLLDFQKNAKSEEEMLSDEEIVEEYITFVFAGMDTTGHLVTMALVMITDPKNKDIMDRARKEAIQYMSKPSKETTIDDINKLEFIMAILKETLRMWTPAPVLLGREVIRDHKIGDIPLKKGDLINCAYIANHYDHRYFKDPHTFNPDRWFDKEQDRIVKENPYAYIPFSAGPRNCIGQHMALLEGRVILACLLRDYDVIPPPNYKLGMKSPMLYEPIELFTVTLVPRK